MFTLALPLGFLFEGFHFHSDLMPEDTFESEGERKGGSVIGWPGIDEVNFSEQSPLLMGKIVVGFWQKFGFCLEKWFLTTLGWPGSGHTATGHQA